MERVYVTDKQFERINFDAAVLMAGDYEDCDFTNCEFQQADLSGYHFSDCRFTGCNLSMVSLNKAALQNMVFKD